MGLRSKKPGKDNADIKKKIRRQVTTPRGRNVVQWLRV